MKLLLISVILSITLLTSNSFGQVPYHKERYVDGKKCLFFYSGVQNGQEQLIDVECFND
jgi:hypothetical protein